MMHKILCFTLGCCLLIGCNSTPNNLASYSKWAKENKSLRLIEQQSADYHFQLEYRPHALLIAQELGPKAEQAKIEGKYEQIKDLQYFNLFVSPLRAKGLSTVSSDNKHDMTELGSYLSYGMQNDLVLVEGQDSMKCVLYHFESYADLNKKNNFVLAFESNDLDNTKEKNYPIKTWIIEL